MRKLKALIAITAVIAASVTTGVFAAPSPVAGVVTVVVPGSKGATAAQVKVPTQEAVADLAAFISENAASTGMVPNVKSTISIVAPADYKGGNVPVVFAVAGLKDGAKNVFAYIRMANGKVLILPCSVKNGYVGFISPVFGDVSIVELNPAAKTAANASTAGSAAAATTVPAKLH